MFQDDRVMSILTGLVIVVAMATLAQRSDDLIDFFLKERAAMIVPMDDAASAAPGEALVIDVLANDLNTIEADRANLRIVTSPACGAAEVAEAGLLYVANDLCVGEQVFSYCAARGDSCPVAAVTVTVTGSGGESPEAASRGVEETALLARPAPEPAGEERQMAGAEAGPEPRAPPEPLRPPAPGRAAPRPSAEERFLAAAPPRPAFPPSPGETPAHAAFTPDAPTEEAPACAPARAASGPAPGGASRVSVQAPCAAGSVVALDHRGLSFPVQLDASGAGEIDLPVLDASAGAVLRVPGGDSLPVPLVFDGEELARIVRVAVAWPTSAAIDLHALEYAAAPGGPGHVRAGGARGAGRVERFAPPPGVGARAEGLQHVEVYSLRLGAGGRRGVARLALDGAGGACAAGRAPEYLVIRAEGGKVRGAASGRLSAEACDAAAGLAARLSAGAVTELRIE